MTFLRTLLVISMLAAVAPAVVKREEFQPSEHQGPVSHMQSGPVYNGPSVYNSQPSSYSNSFVQPQSLLYNQQHQQQQAPSGPNSASADYPEAAASNVQPNSVGPSGGSVNTGQPNGYQQQSNHQQPQQPNLYYYYYPVQPENKPKDAYQAQPSNQYSSQVQPNSPNGQSMHGGPEEQNNNQNGQPSGGHDLNYGAQDLSYTASLNENPNSGVQNGPNGNAPFDGQLSNLASSLQQYGFGSNGGGPGFGGFSSQLGSQLGNFGSLGDAFGNAQMQSPFSNEAFAAAVNQLGGNFGGGSVPSGSSGSGSSASSGLSHLYQQASQMYQGLLGGGNNNNNQAGPGSGNPYAAASQPHASYEPSAPSSYRSKYGLGTIIMPMLALAGLSLLIPTVSSLSTVSSRKKRSANSIDSNLPTAAGSISSYIDRLERYYSLYKTAVEREECMNRIICELGDMVSNVRGKQAFFTVVDKMAPAWMGNKVSVFKSGALSLDSGKCKKYNCH